MAWKIGYRCQSCGYETEVYEGRGFMGQRVVAVSCCDCKSVQPLVVGGIIGDVAPSFSSIVGRLCLQCGSESIREWDGHTCPRCGGTMIRKPGREFWT